jgi:hypothetical protein
VNQVDEKAPFAVLIWPWNAESILLTVVATAKRLERDRRCPVRLPNLGFRSHLGINGLRRN